MKLPRIPLGVIWLVLPAVLVLLAVWTSGDYPLDFWLHVNAGWTIAENGGLVRQDIFTHTIADQPVENQNWLAQLAMHGLFHLGGYALVQFVFGILYAVAVAITTRLIWNRAKYDRVAAGLSILAAALMVTNLGVRPQVFSVLLFALELSLLWRCGRWLLVAAVAGIELAWTNLHGAFPLGVVLPGLFLAGAICEGLAARKPFWRERRVQIYAACVAAAFLAMFVNPNVLRTISYVGGVSSRASGRSIEEWLPTSTASLTGLLFFASIAVTLVLLAISRRRLSPIELILLASFFVLGIRSQRMVIWWGMVIGPVLAGQASQLWQDWNKAAEPREDRSPVNAAVLAMLVIACLFSTPWTRSMNPLLAAVKREAVSKDEPLGAIQFPTTHQITGKAFHPMEWGSYLTWKLNRRIKVFIDSRIESFPDDVWNDYARLSSGTADVQALLRDYQVDLVIWDPRRNRGPLEQLRQTGTWAEVYRDHNSVVLLKPEVVLWQNQVTRN